jgi:hypothetical protein
MLTCIGPSAQFLKPQPHPIGAGDTERHWTPALSQKGVWWAGGMDKECTAGHSAMHAVLPWAPGLGGWVVVGTACAKALS